MPSPFFTSGVRQACKPVSSSAVQRLICVLEMLTSGPSSFCKTSMTFNLSLPHCLAS